VIIIYYLLINNGHGHSLEFFHSGFFEKDNDRTPAATAADPATD